MLGLQA